jgi:hypothetical protein
MTDRYVIVYQDGSMSPLYDATECAYRLRLIKSAAWPVRPPRPAYRIRIREKARHVTRDEHEMLTRALCASGKFQYEFG